MSVAAVHLTLNPNKDHMKKKNSRPIKLTSKTVKTLRVARPQWLTPVILAIQEAEIQRIMVQSQPRKIVRKTLSQKKPTTKKGLVKWLKV
jgi:hypothetical protein